MANAVRLQVVTPERTVLEDKVESVVLPAVDGALGILANHAPLIAGLTTGVVEFGPVGREKRKMAVAGGFVEVAENQVTVLADAAELGEEIDVLRAKTALERARKRLAERTANLDFVRAQRAVTRAMARLRAAGEQEEHIGQALGLKGSGDGR